MKTVAVSVLKARLLALLSELQRTREPILVTKRGKPLARIEPIAPSSIKAWHGRWKDLVHIRGDIIAPACDPSEWEALRD